MGRVTDIQAIPLCTEAQADNLDAGSKPFRGKEGTHLVKDADGKPCQLCIKKSAWGINCFPPETQYN